MEGDGNELTKKINCLFDSLFEIIFIGIVGTYS